MFFKYATLLAFAASAIAGAIEPGVYRISNVASGTTARTYNAFRPVYISNTLEYAGPYELWNIQDSVDGGYILQNVGLRTFAAASHSNGGVVETTRKGTVFNIEAAGNGEFVIKLPYDDLLWNAEPPVVPRGDIKLRPAVGRPTERWILSPARPDSESESAQDVYDEQRELLQRIGRFLRQF